MTTKQKIGYKELTPIEQDAFNAVLNEPKGENEL